LENVVLIDYDEDDEDEKDLMAYLQKKVDRYKQQDRKAKRQMDPKNYITSKWLHSCLGKRCQNCGESLICSKTSNGKFESNLSAQRLSNHDAHHLNNIIPYCIDCNTSLSDKDFV